MKIKNTKSFIEFCEQIGITSNIGKTTSKKFTRKLSNFNSKIKDVKIFEKESIDSIIDKQKLLKDLKKDIFNLNCNLKETSTNIVFGKGDKNAKIMIIGDAPDSEEDRIGEPFVGTEGKLLEKMINCIEIEKKSVYLSNLIFWRPPGNRKPNPEEIELCLPYTKRHINIINPKLLIILGGLAARAILNLDGIITKIRGEKFEYNNNGLSIISHVLYHPSFLLNNPIEKKKTWFDLLKIKKNIKKI